jgi:hypothetical protein
MKTITAGIFNDPKIAEEALNALRHSGIADEQISYIYQNKAGELESHGVEDAVDKSGTDKGKGAASGAASGAVTGGAVGALAGFVLATGVIPGLGAIAVAGPLAAALGLGGAAATAVTGATVGAATGGLVGALTGYGVSTPDAHLYEDRIKEGDVLVVVESEQTGVITILEEHGADILREYSNA